MNHLPTISSYGAYEQNYGINALKVDMGAFELYYSYTTIVAFRSKKTGLVCCENEWSTTTGKHLNWIQPNKRERVPRNLFVTMLKEMLNEHCIEVV